MQRVVLVVSAGWVLAAFLVIWMPVQASPTVDLTFNVDTTFDAIDAAPGNGACDIGNGHCTLRAAIQEANARYALFGGTYTITLPSTNFGAPTVYPLTIAGASEDAAATGDLDIRCNLALIGIGLTRPTIDASAINDRVFQIIPASGVVTVTLRGIRIEHGSANGGAGVLNNGASALTIQNSNVLSNTSTSLPGGGISSFGPLTISNSLIRANRVLSNSAGGIDASSLRLIGSDVISNSAGIGGGGVRVSASAEISNSRILSNSASVDGGGIAELSFALLSISGSDIAGNGAARNGGGIYANALLTISTSTIERNHANPNVGAGGGLYLLAHSWIGDSVIAANDSLDGGGIFVDSTGLLDLRRTTLSQNHAKVGGGLVLAGGAVVSDSTIGDNIAGSGGGGIDVGTGWLALSGSLLFRNNAASEGGGIANNGRITLTNSTLSLNQAANNGGGIANLGIARLDNVTFSENSADSDADNIGDGGGIWNAFGATAALHHTLLAHNLDFSFGGNPKLTECAGTFLSLDYNLVLTTTGCVLTSQTAHNLIGQEPQLNSLADYGGPTRSYALSITSPAINHGHAAGCTDATGAPLRVDQRGFARLGACDIGAFEYVLREFLPLIRR